MSEPANSLCTDFPRTDVPRTDVLRTDVLRTDVPRTDVPRTDVLRTDVPPERLYILFTLANTTYAIPTAFVCCIEMIENITPVPNSPFFVEGVVFFRSQFIPAINLRLKFGFEKIAHNTTTRLIVIQTPNRTAGLIADSAREFISISHSAIQLPPDSIFETSAPSVSGQARATNGYISGIVFEKERTILIIDPEQIIQTP